MVTTNAAFFTSGKKKERERERRNKGKKREQKKLNNLRVIFRETRSLKAATILERTFAVLNEVNKASRPTRCVMLRAVLQQDNAFDRLLAVHT